MSVRMLIASAAWTLALVPSSGLASATDAPESQRNALLVALSGHGLEHEVGTASRAYFCPTDGHSEKVETLLPVMWFYQQLHESKAGMKMLVVDACRNLAQPRAGGVKPVLSSEVRGFMKLLADTAPPRGIAALLSCQSGRFSHEVPELGHGVFMHHVLEGLSGKADLTAGNRDGWVSLPELFNYSSDQTEEYVDNELSDYAWWNGQGEQYAHQVGRKRANPWGLYDMHGNVWERCQDWYGEDYYGNLPTDDPAGPITGSDRVDRGGGWSASPRYCRSANRAGSAPGYRNGSLGFRAAQVRSE